MPCKTDLVLLIIDHLGRAGYDDMMASWFSDEGFEKLYFFFFWC